MVTSANITVCSSDQVTTVSVTPVPITVYTDAPNCGIFWKRHDLAHLCRYVDPNSCIKQDMVTELFEERCTVGKAVQVFGKRQELLQNGPGDVHPR